MPRSASRALSFPLGGVSRRVGYREQGRPYTAPWAVNCRTVGPSESRKRGGSRPGLVKLCASDLGEVVALFPIAYVDSGGTRRYDLVYVDSNGLVGYVRAGTATLLTAEVEDYNGDDVLDFNGDTILFGSTVTAGVDQGAVRAGKVYFADTTLKSYDPATGIVATVTATAGVIPPAEPLIASYRDRIFLAGLTQAWYCSRVSRPDDWDFGAAMEDDSRSMSGQLSSSGLMGDVITAMIPVMDRALVLATENTLWVLRGDPTTGTLVNVSEGVGIISQDAWAMGPDGVLVFLSNDGVYAWDAASNAAPIRFSAERVPEELLDVDLSAYTVSMEHDPVERGFHLFLTPADPATVANHWWIDVDNKALWPQRFQAGHQPLSVAALTEGGRGTFVLGSQDGYLRYFSDGQDDDGSDLESHVLIGPVRLAPDDVRDAVLAEIHGVVDGLAGSMTWRVVMGRSAAEAAAAALDDLEAELASLATSSVVGEGTWVEGRNLVQRPRCRGPWVVVWLSASEAWSFEVVALVARQLGRLR